MDEAGGIGRNDELRAAVVAATQDELIDHGYDALSVEGVARRAGVPRQRGHGALVRRRRADKA